MHNVYLLYKMGKNYKMRSLEISKELGNGLRLGYLDLNKLSISIMNGN